MIDQKVYKIISQIMNIPLEQINENSSYENIENWDSLQHMNLVMALEEDFKVQLTEDDVVKIISAKAIIETLKNKTI